jgi:hypothetical protein
LTTESVIQSILCIDKVHAVVREDTVDREVAEHLISFHVFNHHLFLSAC